MPGSRRITRSWALAAAAAAGAAAAGLGGAAPAAAVGGCGLSAPPFVFTSTTNFCTLEADGNSVTVSASLYGVTIQNASSVRFDGVVFHSQLTLDGVTGSVTQTTAVALAGLTLRSVDGTVALTNAGNILTDVDIREVGSTSASPVALLSSQSIRVVGTAALNGRRLDVRAGAGDIDLDASVSRFGAGSSIRQDNAAVTGLLKLDGTNLAGTTIVGQYRVPSASGLRLAGADVGDATLCFDSGTPLSLPAGYRIDADNCLEQIPDPVYWVSELGAPIDAGVLNVAKAGSTVPFKFSVTKDGVPLTTLTSASTTASTLACSTLGGSDAIETYTSAPGGSLVNNGDGSYQYNYKTQKGWTGCRTLTLDLGSGVTVSAGFQFR